MSTVKRLWLGLAAIVIVSFAVMLWLGADLMRTAPPIPEAVVTESGHTVFTREDIESGQQVWQSIGGQQLGSVWGHGALVAPDWSADWLHRETTALLDVEARERGATDFASLGAAEQASIQASLIPEIRENTYAQDSGILTISDQRAAAIMSVAQHYDSLFSNAPETQELRTAYAMKENTVPGEANRQRLIAFFFWTSWSASTNRPDGTASYTNN